MFKSVAAVLGCAAVASAFSMPELSLRKLADPPLIQCGTSGTNTTWIDSDEVDYFATIVGTKGTGFAVSLNVTQFDTSPSCDPKVLISFVGDGPGDHPYHQFEVYDGAELDMHVSDPAKNFDIMFQSEIICDYTITFDWQVTCNN